MQRDLSEEVLDGRAVTRTPSATDELGRDDGWKYDEPLTQRFLQGWYGSASE